MMDICCIHTCNSLDERIADSLLKLVSEERKDKIKKFKFYQDYLRSLFGELLSRYSICKMAGCRNDQLKFGESHYHKPLLIEPAGMYFNVSHSGEWVVCAVSKEVVGIDVEWIKPIELHIAKRYFAEKEYSYLMSQRPEDQLKTFYLIWTLKESYIKADGRGLSLPLMSFDINIGNNGISIVTDNPINSCFFRTFDLDTQHVMSVCSQDSQICDTVREVTVYDIMQVLSLL